jgi:hypothetical protein
MFGHCSKLYRGYGTAASKRYRRRDQGVFCASNEDAFYITTIYWSIVISILYKSPLNNTKITKARQILIMDKAINILSTVKWLRCFDQLLQQP